MPLSETPVISVSQAVTLCNALLQDVHFRIEGEVANYSLSRGKFIFFDLKDEHEECRVGCFMMAFNLSTPLEDGMRVVIEGRPGLYQKNGGFRITVNRVEPKGAGSLKRAFELLKQKLELEGLFAPERKRTIPRFVRQVGIISSRDAAGFGDFQKIASSRLPGTHFLFMNVAVQGNQAEQEICQAFDYLNSYYTLDAIVLVRGGGSMEDLHAFNSEPVARAISRSKAPVVVGVGHERDVTIADFCADLRASTPSNAAQLLLPTTEEVKQQVMAYMQSGRHKVEASIAQKRQQLAHNRDNRQQQLNSLLEYYRNTIQHHLKTITAISPTTILERGFSLTSLSNGKPVRSVSDVQAGQSIITRLADGTITSITT